MNGFNCCNKAYHVWLVIIRVFFCEYNFNPISKYAGFCLEISDLLTMSVKVVILLLCEPSPCFCYVQGTFLNETMNKRVDTSTNWTMELLNLDNVGTLKSN